MKVDCPKLVGKENIVEKKSYKTRKGRKTYIAWEENASLSSSSSQEEIEAKPCLIAGKSSEVSSMESSASFNSTNYSTLLHAFQETHEEASILALYNDRLKGMNKWLETRVK